MHWPSLTKIVLEQNKNQNKRESDILYCPTETEYINSSGSLMNVKLAHGIKSNAFSTREQSLHYQQMEKYLSARL